MSPLKTFTYLLTCFVVRPFSWGRAYGPKAETEIQYIYFVLLMFFRNRPQESENNASRPLSVFKPAAGLSVVAWVTSSESKLSIVQDVFGFFHANIEWKNRMLYFFCSLEAFAEITIYH